MMQDETEVEGEEVLDTDEDFVEEGTESEETEA